MITNCSDMDNNIGQIKLDEVTGEIYEEQSNLSALRHEILGFIEIGALALGFATGPFAPFFFGVSTAAGLADSAQYFSDGDKYMGCMMLALEIIPGGELFKIFRKGKKTARVLSTTTEVSDDVMKDIIQRGQKGLLNDDTEKAIYQAIREDAAGVVGQTVATTVRQTIKTNIKTNLVNTFKQLGGGWSAFWKIVSFAYNSLGTVPQIIIKVGGTAYSIDQIYLAVYGRDEDRQNSDLRKAYYALKAYLGSGDGQLPEDAQAKADMEAGVKLIQDTFSGNPEKLNKVVDEGLDIKYDEDDINILNYFVNQNKQNVKTAETKKSEVYKTDKDVYKQAPTMEDVKTKNYYLGWGMSGDSITELKKMLSDNWGEYLDQTKLNNTLKNNLFDDDLWDLIFYFQSNIMPNILGIKETNEDMGNVGNQTLSYLKQFKTSSLAPKTTEEVLMDEKDFDFFYYNIRTKKWQPITKQEYFDFKKTGVNVKYERKSLQEPIPFSGTVKVPKKTIFGKIKYVDKK
jgi:hypothetical protein